MSFTPKKTSKKREVLSLHLPEDLSKLLSQALKKSKVTKQELIRQMIRYCCENMEQDKK